MVYKRGRMWWLSLSHRGQQIRKSTGTCNKQLALRIYAKVKHQLEEGQWFGDQTPSTITFAQLLDRYLREHSFVHKRPKTYVRDCGMANHLRPEFGEYHLEEISPSMIVAYKAKRRKEGAAPRTINHEVGLMRHSYNLALKEWGWARENPVTKVSAEPVRTSLERWLREEEEACVVAVSPPWLQDLILFAIHTGLRQSELLHLQWSMIDMNRRTLTLSEQKNGAIDTLPLNQTAMEVLGERAKAHPAQTGYVFATPKGTPRGPRNVLRAFYQACRAAGIAHCRFHDLRHTFATRLVQRGVDLYTVQKLGRWKTLSMVQRYAHHNPDSLRPGIERLNQSPRQVSQF